MLTNFRGAVLRFQDKGASQADSIHIGLIGVASHPVFWQILERLYAARPESTELSDVHALDEMLRAGTRFRSVPYKVWLDTGNPAALSKADAYLREHRS